MYWDIIVNGEEHKISLEGFNLSGKAKIKIDENINVYSPVTVKNIGQFFLFEIGSSEFVIRFDPDNNRVRLIQDGIYLDTGMAIESEAVAALRAPTIPQQTMPREGKTPMASFLTFVIATYVNLVLLIINAPFSFPFSAVVPQYIIGLAVYFYDSTPLPSILFIGISIAVICASIYLILYILARKRTWPIIVALILIGLDTLVVLYFALNDFTYYIIDIAFHAWIIWDFVKLLKSRSINRSN